MTAKQQLTEAIQSLPEDASMEEAVKRLYLLYTIQRGMAHKKVVGEPATDFWIEPTIEELATEQGVAIPQSMERLAGQGADLWSSEEEFDSFLSEIYQRRHAA